MQRRLNRCELVMTVGAQGGGLWSLPAGTLSQSCSGITCKVDERVVVVPLMGLPGTGHVSPELRRH